MRVSVVIPCHNAGRWIDQTLQGVVAQTHAPHEVIVVDDASTDDSAERVRRAGVGARVIPAAVRNAAAARNIGMEAAGGDWIALLDADDVWDPDHLARAAAVLAGTTDVAYRALCDDLTAAGTRSPVTRPQPIAETRTGLTHHEYMRLEDGELYFGHSSVLYRRDRVMEVGGFDPAQVRRHDIDLWLRVIQDRTWAWDATATVAYRCDTPGSISRNYLSCEVYYLRALVKNRAAYAGPWLDARLAKIARRVATIAFTDAPPDEARAALAEAWPHLPAKVRAAYRIARLSPPLARAAIRWKRAVFSWRTGARLPDLNPQCSRCRWSSRPGTGPSRSAGRSRAWPGSRPSRPRSWSWTPPTTPPPAPCAPTAPPACWRGSAGTRRSAAAPRRSGTRASRGRRTRRSGFSTTTCCSSRSASPACGRRSTRTRRSGR
jgi:glycosyltransferase involved in cell wall biosynthesis